LQQQLFIEFCGAVDKTPDVSFKGNFNVGIFYAEEHDLNLNKAVQLALKEYMIHAE
jgi:hypothetical protein